MSVLAYDRVVKTYGPNVALDGVGFAVEKGEIFGLLGPNGAGKTSLIRLALDIIRPDSGTVRVFDRAPTAGTLDRVSYMPEERGLYRKQRVLDVLVYLGELKGLTRSDARGRAHDWLRRIGLPEVADRRVESLSKGMSQKIQIAAALLTDPELAILDEPFSGLDPVNARLVDEVIAERRARGLTTVLSSHQMDRVEALCDRIVLLHRGRVLLEGPVATLRAAHAEDGDHPTLETLFVRAIGAAEKNRGAS